MEATTSPSKDQMEDALLAFSENSIPEQKEGLETLQIYAKNLVSFPEDSKYRSVKISNIHYQLRLGHMKASGPAMTALGFQPKGDFFKIPDQLTPDETAKVKECADTIAARLEVVTKQWNALPKRLDSKHVYGLVVACGAHGERGMRPTMEDEEIVIDPFWKDSCFFGLYDGHGGREVVDYVVKALHLNIFSQLKLNPEMSVAEAMNVSYKHTDEQMRRQNLFRGGTTTVTCVLQKHEDGSLILTAGNVGDSRAVLCRNNVALRLTLDHKPCLPEETRRILDAGGFVSTGGGISRVNGELAVSRALGDLTMKENHVVSPFPYTQQLKLEPGDSYLLLACDGVWDVMTDQQAVDTMLRLIERRVSAVSSAGSESAAGGPSLTALASSGDIDAKLAMNEVLREVSRDLALAAIGKGSQDNVTVMCVQLQ